MSKTVMVELTERDVSGLVEFYNNQANLIWEVMDKRVTPDTNITLENVDRVHECIHTMKDLLKNRNKFRAIRQSF